MKPKSWTKRAQGDERLVTMTGVREYSEGYEVKLDEHADDGPAIVAINEGGYNATYVNLRDVIAWVRANRPALLDS
jgi:hypothetical protein